MKLRSFLQRHPLPAALILALALLGAAGQADAGLFDRLKERIKSSQDQPDEEAADETSEAPSEDQVGKGLKEALSVGIDTVVAQLGATDGFNLDPAVHIPLPGTLDKVRSTLEKFGLSSQFEELELGLNRAAEVAVPKSRELLQEAVRDMTLEDVMEIYRGPDDAATQYFRGRMSAPLQDAMRPIVDESLGEVGAADVYGKIAGRYNNLPLVEPVDADLSPYVLEKATDGVFHYLAREEAAIRSDPVKRTTELLKQIFGG